MRAVVISTLMIAGVTMFAQPAGPASAAGVIGGFNIDGVVLGTGGEEVDAVFFPDPSGNTDELGAVNSNTTKIGNIHGDTPPTLEYTNPNPGNDLTGVWLDTNVDANGDIWLYFAFSRESATNGQVGFEFQRADAPLLNGSPLDYGQLEVVNPPGAPPGSYTASVIADYNPWSSRTGDGAQGSSDFLIVFDIQGNSLDVGTRLFDSSVSQGGQSGGWTPLALITDPSIADAEIDLGDPNDTGDDGLRGEGAINLSETVFPSEPDSCLSIASIIPYTVTGNSDQADFKDVVLADFPSEITISSCGSVRITKTTDPAGGTGSFPYTLAQDDGGVVDFDGDTSRAGTLTEDGDSDLVVDLIADTDYTLAEGAVGPAWVLESIVCDGQDITAGGTFSVVAGETTDCTITNRANEGTLTLVKEVDNLGESGPGYLGPNDFGLTIDGNLTGSGDAVTVTAGDHTIAEVAQAGYTVGSWSCDDGTSGAPGVTSAVVNVGGGEVVVCTIRNTLIAQPALTLVKTASPTTYDTVGDVISYTYDVTNSGNVSLAGPVTVADDKASVTCPDLADVGNLDGDLDLGETVICTASYTITQADLNAGSVTNVATASADGTDSNQDDETVTANQNPALTLVKTASPATYDTVGQSVSYSYDVTNSGNVSLAGPVTVADDKASVICPAVTSVGNNDGNLDPGESITCSASYTITQADLNAGSVTNVATASADGTDSNQDDETVTANQNPALTLVKTALPATYDTVGQSVSYSYDVTNSGNVSLAGPVTVADDKATVTCLDVTTVGNGDGNLDPGEGITCSASYTITQADLDSGSVTNVATASAGGTDSNQDDETVTANQNPAISADKVLHDNADEDGSNDVSLGDTLTYRITATNSGNVTLTNVTVDDDLTGTADALCAASLAPGASCFVDVTYVVTQADVDAGQIDNLGAVEGTPPVGDPVTDDDPETVGVPQNPALAVDKGLTGNADEDGSGTVSLNDTLTYTVTATNTGNVTLTNVMVSDNLTSPSITVCPSVLPGGTCVLVGTYQVTQADVDAGEILNLGVANSDETPPVEDPEDVPVPQNPSIDLLKTGSFNDESGDGFADAGETISYSFTVTNDGNVTLTNVTVDDLNVAVFVSGGPIASLAPGASDALTFTGSYTITQADVDTGFFVNTAMATGTDPNGDPRTDIDTHNEPLPQAAAIVADKVLDSNADEDLSGDVSLNDTLTYRITATNTGNVTLTNVTVDDDLTGISDAPCAASLAPTQSCSVLVNYVVKQTDVDAGVIDNTGTVEGTPPSGGPVTDSDDESVPVPQNPALAVDKALTGNDDPDGSGDVSVGDTLTYTITATNTGDVTLTSVSVTDDLTGDSTSCASVAPGDTCVLVVNYVVMQTDVDAGQITNIGEADSDQTPPVEDPEVVPVPQNPAIEILKSSSLDLGADGIATPGDVISYSFTVTNTGDVTLSDVTVNDAQAGVSDCVIGTMAPLAVDDSTCSGTYAITQTDIDSGSVFNQAFVAGEAPQGDPGDPGDDVTDDDENTQPLPQGPALAVDKALTGNADEDGSGDVSAGDTLEYTITATNTGNVTLNNVVVSDDLTGASTSCASVAPGGNCVLVTSYVVTAADVAAGEILNTGTADSDETPPVDDPNNEPVPQPLLAVDKVLTGNDDADGSITVSLGDTLSYSITATNTGGANLTDVTVVDSLTGDSTVCAIVLPGGICTLDVTYTVQQSDVDAGEVVNVGTADSDQTPPIDDPNTEPVPQNPAILAGKVLQANADGDASNTVSLGDALTYRITATNTGNVTLTNVTVDDDLTGTTDAFCAASLAPGESCFVDVTYVVTQADVDAGRIDNLGTVEGTDPGGDPVTDDDPETVDVPQDPALQIVKSFTGYTDFDTNGEISINDLLKYDLVATNNGNVTLTNVTVSDSLTGDSTACASVAPGATCLLQVTHTVTQADVDAGNVANTGVADSDQTPPDEDDEDVPVPQHPGIEINKSGALDLGIDDIATPGDLITYEFVVTNTGNVTLSNVVVSDPLISDIDCGDGTANIGTMAPSPAGVTCTGSYALTQTDIDAGVRNNVADADGTDPNGDPVNDDDGHSEPIPQDPKLNIDKAAGEASFDSVGDVLTYTITAVNTGNVTLNGVTVVDPGVDGLTCTPANGATLAPGDVMVCTGTHTVTQADLDAGSYANTACVNDGLDGAAEVCDGSDVPADQNPAIDIDKSPDTQQVAFGDDAVFTITVTNIGNVTLTDVIVTDPLSAGCDRVFATMAPGDVETYGCSTSVDDDFTNVASVTGSPPPSYVGDDPSDVDDAFVDALPAIQVTKTPSKTEISEPGELVDFEITVTNLSGEPALLTDLVDDVFGDLDGIDDCVLTPDQPLAPNGEPGDSYTCTLRVFLAADFAAGDHQNTVTATAQDDDGNTTTADDTATVVTLDVPSSIDVTKTANPASVPETGGDVTYTFSVLNTSPADDVTIDALVDSIYGDLNGQGDCSTGATLAPGDSYTCLITVAIAAGEAGDVITNVLTVDGTDDDGDSVDGSDDAVVTLTDVLPDVSIMKTANPTSVPEPGADVEFAVVVTNNSLEDATVDSLVDSDFDLSVHCPEAVGTVLGAGDSYTCIFTEFIAGNVGEDHQNTATVVASDNDGNSDTESDDADVTITNVAPEIDVTKTPNQDEVFAPGEDVTFTIRVENTGVSTDPVTITTLIDDVFGDVSAECVLPQTIGSGGAFECDITRAITADHTNTVTATAFDDEGTEVSDSASASVEYSTPAITIEKSTGPADADAPPGPEILVGETVTWFYQVTNVGDVPLSDLVVVDDQGVTVNCATSVLPAGATTVCSGSGIAEIGQYGNIGTATGSYTDADGDVASPSASDPSHYFGAAPAISIDKLTNGADGQTILEDVDLTWTYQVTNVGNVSLIDVNVSDDQGVVVACPVDTLAPGESTVCTASGTATAGDYANVGTVTANYTDDLGNTASPSDSDDSSYFGAAPSIAVDKLTNGQDGGTFLEGADLTWTYQVTNDGNVSLSGITVTDDQGVTVVCPASELAPGESTVCVGTGTATVGDYANVGTASGDFTDDLGNSASPNDSDPSSYFGADPSVALTKTFAEDNVIAGGAAGSFTLVVTNDGNVDLDDVSVFDDVDDRLTVTAVSGTAGADADSDGDAQTVEWLISSLAVGESVTISVAFDVAADVLEADGPGGLNDAARVTNTATVSNTYTDDSGNTRDIGDEDADTVGIRVDINLSIIKTFDPTEVPQGTLQSFTMEVSNAGPSDAVDVSVTDAVNTSLEVQGVSVTSGAGDCSASAGQDVDCTVQIPAGGSVTITVDYLVAPFLDEDRMYPSDVGGDEFRFVFVNGSILEGSTSTGEIYLDGIDVSGDTTFVSSVTRNDIIVDLDGAGPDPAFEMHLSCSDPFTGGWGQSAGPVEGVDVNWQIGFFSIARYNNNGFIKNCGNVVVPFDVPNTASATGEDSFGTDTVSDDATVTVGPGITLDKLTTKGKRLTVRLTNFTGDDKVIVDVSAVWPNSNGNLTKTWLTQDGTSTVFWSGNDEPTDAFLDATDPGWNGATLLQGEGIMRFDFANKVAKTGYTIRVNFADGTFLDISK